MRTRLVTGVLLLAASVPLCGCIVEPDHDRDRGHDRVYVEGDHHEQDREHCDRDGDHCER